MTDNKFNDIIERLKEIHNDFPDMRFSQVLQNAVDKKFRRHNKDLNELSSKEIHTALGEFKEEHKIKRKKKDK